jgi:lactoylglutathione lyase
MSALALSIGTAPRTTAPSSPSKRSSRCSQRPPAFGDDDVRGELRGLASNHSGRLEPSVFQTGFVNLYTNDIEAAIRFYEGLLGFRETFRTPKAGVPEHVEFALEGFKLGLGTVDAAKRVHGVEPSPGTPASVVVLWCDDVDAEFARLTVAGVRAEQEPHDTGNNNRNALLRDPDGNLVEIVSKRA